jgi:diguanylate cyclase (GGDEF)-like protein
MFTEAIPFLWALSFRQSDGAIRMSLDLSPQSPGRVILATIAGTLICMTAALLTVSYTTQFMPPQAQGLTWAASFILPLILSAPICFYFANTLRRLAIAHQKLEVVAAQDSLTTCLNRGAFLTLVDAYLDDVHSEPPNGAVLLVDADHFKAINDRWGHGVGDDALRLIVSAMRSVVRPIDLIGRIGGEEFAIFLPKLDRPAAEEIAERVRHAVATAPFQPDGQVRPLSVSVGAVVFRGRLSVDALLARADALLYAAKQAGRDRVEFARETLAA